MINETWLENWITWKWFSKTKDQGLDGDSEEHIESLMKEGFTSGELCKTVRGKEIRGWWERR